MSIRNNFPTIRPSLNLDFANVKALDPRITFTRTTTATYYDGKTTAKAEENLLLQSQTLNTTWTATNASVTANTEVAPDGTTTAETITDTAVDLGHFINQAITTNLSTDYVFSVFLKAGTSDYAAISLTNPTVASRFATITVDLNAGTIGDTETSNATVLSSSITSFGNGWYRVVMVASATTTAFTAARIALSDSGTPAVYTNVGQPQYLGTGTTIFAWGAQLEQRSAVSAYTPTTTQPITNYIPVLQTAASGVARFDHNPTTGESLGLLVEEQRSNLLLRSEDLDTTWSETRATLGLNSVVAPDGTLTADRLIDTTDNDTHFTTQTFTGTAASHTFSVYAKASGLNHVALRLFNGTSQVGLAYYNLSTGATGTVTAGTASIQSVGNGWYRCVLTATLAASASCTADIYLANADNTNSFAGNAFNGVALWGAQLEAGAFPTSYIKTEGSTVTRNADAASMTGTNFSSWFNNAEGSLYGEVASAAITVSGTSRRIANITDGTENNRITIGWAGATNVGAAFVTTNNATQAGFNSPSGAYSLPTKVILAYNANDFGASVNGSAFTSDTSGTVPVVNQMRIGDIVTGGTIQNINGTIKKLSFYPARLSNAQLQALTTV